MYCKNCGNEIAEDSKYCKFCGKPVENVKTLSGFKLPKLDLIGYIYILWFIIHFCLFLFGGKGYTVQNGRYWYSPNDYLYPDGPFRVYWGANYYDITDLIFYVIVVPLTLYTVNKLYRIWKRK